MPVLQTPTDDKRRRQTTATVTNLVPYTMCRRPGAVIKEVTYLPETVWTTERE